MEPTNNIINYILAIFVILVIIFFMIILNYDVRLSKNVFNLCKDIGIKNNQICELKTIQDRSYCNCLNTNNQIDRYEIGRIGGEWKLINIKEE